MNIIQQALESLKSDVPNPQEAPYSWIKQTPANTQGGAPPASIPKGTPFTTGAANVLDSIPLKSILPLLLLRMQIPTANFPQNQTQI